jgi:hypothetical protein
MKGNFHVRFLGEGAAATPLPYPTLNKKLKFEVQQAGDDNGNGRGKNRAVDTA